MSPPLLLRIAAVLAFITCLGHTIGTFMEVPAEQTAMHETIAQMKRTMVPMPVGPARSYMQILDGNNLCTSLLLGLCGALLLIVSKGPASSATRRITLLTALALAFVAAPSSATRVGCPRWRASSRAASTSPTRAHWPRRCGASMRC